jgi:hypothetical protein
MRGHGLTVVFCLVIVGFITLVAAEDYAWTSREAYLQVRLAEVAVTAILVVGFYLVLGVYALIDWCHYKWWRFSTWLQQRRKR